MQAIPISQWPGNIWPMGPSREREGMAPPTRREFMVPLGMRPWTVGPSGTMEPPRSQPGVLEPGELGYQPPTQLLDPLELLLQSFLGQPGYARTHPSQVLTEWARAWLKKQEAASQAGKEKKSSG